jgi:hypothetical protein
MSLMKSPIVKRKHKYHLVKFKGNVILVVHKKSFLKAVPFRMAGFFISWPPDFSHKFSTQQHFNAPHFESSSALNIEMGKTSVTYFDDNELRASVWSPSYFLYYTIHYFALFHT